MNIEIRKERSSDVELIHEVVVAAFCEAPHADHTEQFIVKALREAGALTISLVAEVEREVIGHVAVSSVAIAGAVGDWYGLGPISVLPAHQGRGVGSQLMRKALTDLKESGAAGCVVLGDPSYYGRFGFEAMEGLVFPGAPPEYFQALSFSGTFARGTVTYHEAFSAQG